MTHDYRADNEFAPVMKLRGFEVVSQAHRTHVDVQLPVRGTKTSAGYDFFATEELVIKPQQTVKFKTNVKAYMGADEVLLIDIRSSIGTKKDLMIANTLGVVDSDYYENVDNDGNLMIALRNLKPALEATGLFVEVVDTEGVPVGIPFIADMNEKNTVVIKAGERVAQGIFVKFLESDNCNTENERVGGVGSTSKQHK
ncbi:dUTPase [Desulfosporosinus burensis]